MRWTLLVLLLSTTAFAQNKKEVEPDFDSLGGNSILLDRAKALNPKKK